jgi:hypothetical protein
MKLHLFFPTNTTGAENASLSTEDAALFYSNMGQVTLVLVAEETGTSKAATATIAASSPSSAMSAPAVVVPSSAGMFVSGLTGAGRYVAGAELRYVIRQ